MPIHDYSNRKSSLLALARTTRLCYVALLFAWTHGINAVSQQTQRPVHPEAVLESPITVETLFGNDRLDLQVVIHTKFAPQSHAAFLSVTSSQGQQNGTLTGFDFVNVTQASYNVYKGFGPNIGVALNRAVGFNTTAGLQYGLSKRAFSVVLSSSAFLNGDHDLENVLVANFRPAISRHWRLYEAVTVLDEHDFEEALDARRFVHVRSGAQYKRFGFGFGSDFDWYGIPKSFRTNYGPVLAYSF